MHTKNNKQSQKCEVSLEKVLVSFYMVVGALPPVVGARKVIPPPELCHTLITLPLLHH